eukprot:CAMPEP_0176307344 /NCGR_PEP_ID=MMETSP0121_2-20121125/63968_1 /TAXON_ID=160619 /ORGANISM="Kryptoperidinium foliaceum, Strain CCMP 1326" /LENGTH=33 /DNA_ID= /DNA_START= /DNA_END= /DNA_ORIENTATION=
MATPGPAPATEVKIMSAPSKEDASASSSARSVE